MAGDLDPVAEAERDEPLTAAELAAGVRAMRRGERPIVSWSARVLAQSNRLGAAVERIAAQRDEALAEVKRLRADREKAREALRAVFAARDEAIEAEGFMWIGSAHELHGALDRLRAALSEPPAGS